jgi:uncharacterized protein (TIGR02466 family)
MPTRQLFATHFYEGSLDDAGLLAELDDACRELADEDGAGRAWSEEHGYRGYTSYASLNDLPQRDPRFGDLVRHLNRHVAAFAKECGFELGGKRLKLDSLWVNVLEPGGTHSGHIHPHSVVSGTIYVAVPPGAGSLKLEDPRLPLMMAAPTRPGTFVYAEPSPGTIFLWESWLRHEVPAGTAGEERISISFNYRR